MVHIDILTLNNEFKDNDGRTWKVSSNFSDKNKLYVELEVVTPQEALIKE